MIRGYAAKKGSFQGSRKLTTDNYIVMINPCVDLPLPLHDQMTSQLSPRKTSILCVSSMPTEARSSLAYRRQSQSSVQAATRLKFSSLAPRRSNSLYPFC